MPSSALGTLVASVVLDATAFFEGTKQAQVAAASMASSVDKAVKDVEKSVTGSVRSMAEAFASGFGVAALVEMGQKALDTAETLRMAAQRASVTVEQFSALAFAARQSGVSLEALETGAKKLNVAIADTAAGGTKYSQLFKGLGVDIDKSSTSSEGFNKVLLEVADTFAKSADGPVKVAAAVQLFGKSGADMIPLLNQGSEAIRKLQAEAADLGLVLGANAADQVRQYHENLDKLTNRGVALATVLSNSVLPSLNRVLGSMIEGVKQGGLYEAAIRGMTEAFIQMEGEGAAAELKRINDQLNAVSSGAFMGWTLSAKELNALLERRKQLESEIFQNELAAQNKRAIDGQIAARRPGLDPNALGLGGASASGAGSDSYIANLQKEADALGVLTGWSHKYSDALVEIARLKQEGKKVDEDKILALATEIDDYKNAVIVTTSYNKVLDELDAAEQQKVDRARQLVEGLDQQNERTTFENSLIGASIEKIHAENIEYERRIALRGVDDQVTIDAINARYDSAKALAAEGDAARGQLSIWTDLSSAAGKFFGDLIVNGKSAFDRLKQSVKEFAQEMIALFAQKFILQLAASALGAGAAGNALANAAGSLGGNTVAGALGSSLIGGAGDFSSALAGTFVGPTTAFSGAGIGSAIAEAIGVIPVWGQIALAIGALAVAVGLFSKGGGPKDGGSFNGNFSASGTFLGSTAVAGTDNGRFYTPNGQDSSLATIGKGVGSTYGQIMAALGVSGSAFQFGLGFDTDPHGTAPNRISSQVRDANGNLVFGSNNRDIGRDSSQVQPELQLEASRMVLAAIKSSNLPAYLAKVFDGLSPSTATQEQITAAEQTAAALKSVMDTVSNANPVADASKLLADSSNQFQTALRNNAAAMNSVISKYDGSTASAQNLATATQAYYNAQVQLLASIQQAKESISQMFGDTSRGIKLSTMDKQGQYDFYEKEAKDLEAQALASNDPAKIQALAQRINADQQAAWNLLTPDEQKQHAAEFISQGDAADTAIQARLDKISKNAADATKEMLDKIKTILTDAGTTQTNAANTNLTAANTNLTAATTPLVVNVNLTTDQRVTG